MRRGRVGEEKGTGGAGEPPRGRGRGGDVAEAVCPSHRLVMPCAWQSFAIGGVFVDRMVSPAGDGTFFRVKEDVDPTSKRKTRRHPSPLPALRAP